ncbi:MAG TPA: hypothetical protein VM367_12060 [Pseudonocardia sp.]|nr:hypothetical protein [Pseudonocardia sp.]
MTATARDREPLIIRAFVELADTLVDDYDLIDLLDRLVDHSVALLAADSAGIMLGDADSTLWLPRPMTAASGWSCCSCRPTKGPAWTATAARRRSG